MHTLTVIPLRPGRTARLRRAIDDLARALDARYRRWLDARQALATARALSQLDDRILRDLGLDRSELLSAGDDRLQSFSTSLPQR
jgi:uncharacterized protein YjiS (DUF1127 family)